MPDDRPPSRCKVHGPECPGHANRAQEERPVLEVEEFRALVRACESDEERAALLTAYDAALRSGELAPLRWSDFDFRARAVTVRRARKGRDRRGNPKPPRVVKIPVEETALEALRGLSRTGQRRQGPFPAKTWGARQFQRWFAHLCERADVPGDKRFSHILRASRATHIYEADPTTSVKDIQRQLGHWSESTSFIYIRMTEERKRIADRRAARVMKDVLGDVLKKRRSP